MKQTNLSSVIGRWFVVAVPYLWLLVLFLIPFLIVLKISFAEQDIAIPPYTPKPNNKKRAQNPTRSNTTAETSVAMRATP